MLDEKRLNKLVYRFISGYEIFSINGFDVKYSPPTRLQLGRADLYWQECYERNKYRGFISTEETESVLIDMGLWTSKKTEELNIIKEKPKEIRLAMYEAYESGAPWKYLKKTLQKTENTLNSLSNQRSCLNPYTLEGFCSWQSNEKMVFECCSLPLGFESNSKNVLNLMSKIASSNPSDKHMEKAIRTNLFLSYWNIYGVDMFDSNPCDSNTEQRSVANLAMTIDRAAESAEAPDSEVIKDPDLFAGWLIARSDRAKTKKLKSEIDSKVSSNKSKVFVVANERMTPKDIYNMNSKAGKQRLQSMGK